MVSYIKAMQMTWWQNMFVNLLVLLSGKLLAGWVKGFSRLYCLLEGVDSLGQKSLLSHHIPTLNNQAESICQLSWYKTHFLLMKQRLNMSKLFNVQFQIVNLPSCVLDLLLQIQIMFHLNHTNVLHYKVVIKPTAVPSTVHSALPDRREASARAQKLHWTGMESCWSASSPYFFPGMNTETVLLSRTEEIKKEHWNIPWSISSITFASSLMTY